jgi:hypothetical protein
VWRRVAELVRGGLRRSGRSGSRWRGLGGRARGGGSAREHSRTEGRRRSRCGRSSAARRGNGGGGRGGLVVIVEVFVFGFDRFLTSLQGEER